MYVSYPRTEDHTITHEQFKELLPLVDKIAAVVGVDASLLTQRTPRKTHVKDSGAHGANRPGPKVPGSLAELAQKYGPAAPHIYEALAKSYLAMLAEDYTYEQQKGHVERYPAFVGVANVPQGLGWKQVFDPDAEEPGNTGASSSNDGSDDSGESESVNGLGRNAEPFVHEGANKRPEHPSMKWLMKQLEKRDVGTGATRTSTYSEITSDKARYPLLLEKGRKLLLAEPGRMSWLLLPGTKIGDLSLTEQVYADMRDIAAGTVTGDQRLALVAGWVREDIATMQANAATMRAELGLAQVTVQPKVKTEGVWAKTGQQVAFNRVFGGHEFTDDEVTRLLAGEEISFPTTSKKTGKPYTATGSLAQGTFKGRPFVGFKLSEPDGPTSWCQHRFTDDEVKTLLAGGKVHRTDFVSKKNKPFETSVSWDAKTKKIVSHFDDAVTDSSGREMPPTSWCKHTFTDDERDRLADGQTIFVTGFVSTKGKSFDAKVTFKEEGGAGGRKKIVPAFG